MALLHLKYDSEALRTKACAAVVLPLEHRAAQAGPFRTLYLLHGVNGNCSGWLTGTNVKRYAEQKGLAVVMPSGANSFYVDHPNGDQYGDFIGRELVETTRRMFPLSEKREDTFLAGLSMGGYGALRNGLKYAGTFGAAAGLSSGLLLDALVSAALTGSPTPCFEKEFYESVFGDLTKLKGSDLDPEALVKKRKTAGLPLPRLYLACGTEDPLLDCSRSFHRFLDAENVPHVYEEGPGAHEWDFWDRYIRRVIDWLFAQRS
jgi:putative tributyrin esterase